VLLRPPEELSDGQRWRLRLAHAVGRLCEPAADKGVTGDVPATLRSRLERRAPFEPPAEAGRPGTVTARPEGVQSNRDKAGGPKGARRPLAPMRVLVADEFASTLDRLCARAVAYRLRRLADREGITVLAASAHDDIVEDLAPDVLIVKEAGARVEVRYADALRGTSGGGELSRPQSGRLEKASRAKRAAGGRRCTLLDDVRVERGTREDWDRLAPLHYRSHHAGAVSDIFRMVYERGGRECDRGLTPAARKAAAREGVRQCSSRPRKRAVASKRRETLVGVIVYSRSPLSLAARNRATGGRYRVGRNLAVGRLVNEELRIVSRVVIAPNWRGLGLASRLVAETLPRVGTPYVEALAAMGRVHPFFEQAGMTAYPCAASCGGEPGPAASERLRSALEAVGLGRSARRSAEALEAALESLAPAARRLAEREIERWARSYLAAKNHRSRRPERRRALDLVARHLDSAPVYYLWRRPDTRARGEGAKAREVPG